MVDNKQYNIAAYTRISVDDDLSGENVSIENQKSILNSFLEQKFPNSKIDFYEDRDKSGYTFEQRLEYQKMRSLMMSKQYHIMIVKDLSRFSRRNSKGLVELEDLRDAGIRIIAVDDNIDYPLNDDWLTIQFRFLMNELPITDTSKKIKSVIKNRQNKGEWICNVPYGYYLHPTKKNEICMDEEGIIVIRIIFDLYNKGWGYKKIRNYLTANKYPTGMMLIKKRKESEGLDTSKLRINPVWSISTISRILQNDFYIGTLRQNMWTRKGINKADVRVALNDQIVFENHHLPIIDKDIFDQVQQNLSKRVRTYYKGERKYPIPYTGYLFCEDCQSPMFSISNPNRPKGYICGAYHKLGLKGCTSHHIHESILDENLKSYIKLTRDNLYKVLADLDFEKNQTQINTTKNIIVGLELQLNDIKMQLRETTKQKIKALSINPQEELIILETYLEIEKEYYSEIKRIEQEIDYLKNEKEKRAEIKKNISNILNVFQLLLEKESFNNEDISLIVEKIYVNQNKLVTIKLNSNINELFNIPM